MIVLPIDDVCHFLRTVEADWQVPTLVIEEVEEIDMAVKFRYMAPVHFNLAFRTNCQLIWLEIVQDAVLLECQVALAAHLNNVPELFLAELFLNLGSPFQQMF